MKPNDPVAAVAMADHNGLHGIDALEALLPKDDADEPPPVGRHSG